MSSGQTCQECGAAITAGTPAGLCGQCLFALGLEQVKPGPEWEAAATAPGEDEWARDRQAEQSEQSEGQIGHYKLLQEIGQGGFGEVYMAEQQEPVRRRVALKVIKLGMNTKQVVARFEVERQALALMDHPNIAKVFDAGASETGRPYFVMELVQGFKITDYCDQHQLSTRQRLELFVQVCRAVQHAHQKGIIHRDLKPSNILVTLRDGAAVPKIIDFGIAKATQAELTEQTVFTEFGQFIGTPAYMSPEQAEPSRLDVDTRSDIYSLGVLLYELLTGATPFETKELLAGGWEQMRQTIGQKEPMRPSTRLNTLGPAELSTVARHRQLEGSKLINSIRGDLDWIVMKCLEKERTRRYETANGLALDIERHLKHEPVAARPPSRLYEFQKSVRRHKGGYTATALIMMALMLGLMVSMREAVRARRAELEVGDAKNDATERLWNTYLAEARARRHSGESGQRLETLAAVSNAAIIRPSLELRNEAVAALALADLRLVSARTKQFNAGQSSGQIDDAFERYAASDSKGVIHIKSMDDQELGVLPAVAGSGACTEMIFSQDGGELVAAYPSKRVLIWDIRSRKVLREELAGWSEVSRNFRYAIECQSNRLAFWDTATHEKRWSINMGRFRPAAGTMNPDGRLLAVWSHEDETNIFVLDAHTGTTIATLGHPDLVGLQVAWHPNGRLLATGCNDNQIYVWDAIAGRRVRVLEGHKGTPVSEDFSHDGKLLASSGWDGRTILWDVESGRQLVCIGVCGFISFGPSDRSIVLRNWDLSQISLLDVAYGQEVRSIYERGRVPGPPNGSALFNGSGQWLAYDTSDGAAIYNVAAQREIGFIAGHVGVCGFGELGQSLIGVRYGVDGRGHALRWALGTATNDETTAVKLEESPVAQVIGVPSCLSHDRKFCAVLDGTRVHVVRADTFLEEACTGIQRGMTWAAWSPDNKLLATGPFHGYEVKVWDAVTGNLVKELPIAPDIATVAFSPDGRWLVVGEFGKYQFWEVKSWTPGRSIPRTRQFVPMLAFSQDSRILAGTSQFTKVVLFNAATGEELAELEPQNPWQVTQLDFSPDGTKLAVCEGHNALLLWDLLAIRKQLTPMRLDWESPQPASEPASRGTK